MNFLKKVNLEQFNDPFQLDDILSYVDSLSPKDTAAKAAVDIALHDLVGKLLGAPWYKIWGLNKEKTPSTTFTIGIDTLDVVREKTKECADRFNILKVKLGRDNDKEMIETIRSVTDLPIAVDANQGWKDRLYALDMIHWLKEKGIVMIEQPMPKEQLDDIAWITQQSPLPIFADESLQRLADVAALKGAFTGINIKLMKCGGLYPAEKINAIAEVLETNLPISLPRIAIGIIFGIITAIIIIGGIESIAVVCEKLVPLMALFYVVGNEHGIWLSWPIGWFLGSGLSVFFYKSGAWKKNLPTF